MEIKTKFNIGEKVFYNLVNILTVVKAHPLFNDKEIFNHCYGEGFVVGIEISFDVNDKKPVIQYIINDRKDADVEDIAFLECSGALKYDEEIVSNNREELEKTIHDIHIAELKIMNEKIVNLMK